MILFESNISDTTLFPGMKTFFSRAVRKYKRDGFLELIKKSGEEAKKIPGPLLYEYYFLKGIRMKSRDCIEGESESIEYGKEHEFTLVNDSDHTYIEQIPELDWVNKNYSFGPHKIFIIDDAILEHSNNLILSDGIIIESCLARKDMVERKLLFNTSLVKKIKKLDENVSSEDLTQIDSAVSLCDGMGYSKWILKGLPRLETIDLYQQNNGKKFNIILPENPPDYVTQSLKYFGYDNEIIQLEKSTIISECIIPMHRSPEHLMSYYDHSIKNDLQSRVKNHLDYKMVDPRSIQWLHEEAQDKLSSEYEFETPNRFFISREDTSEREVVNRQEVYNKLEEYGFKKVVLSEMEFEKQVSLFLNAEFIIGAHGAGLSNLVFAEDCTVVELFGEKIKPTYYMLSKIKGLDYEPVKFEEFGNDIRIDINKLDKKISYIGLQD